MPMGILTEFDYKLQAAVEEKVLNPRSNTDTSTGSGSGSNLDQLVFDIEIMQPGILCALRAGDKESLLQRIANEGMVIDELVDKQGNSILHLAAALGHDHIVEYTVSKLWNLLERQNLMGETALHVAARSGNLSVVEYIVEYTKEDSSESLVALKSNNGDTALHASLKAKHLEVAFYLVSVRHDLSFDVNNDQVTPLYLLRAMVLITVAYVSMLVAFVVGVCLVLIFLIPWHTYFI